MRSLIRLSLSVSSSKNKAAAASELLKEISNHGLQIDEETKQAFIKDKGLHKDLEKNYPALYQTLKYILTQENQAADDSQSNDKPKNNVENIAIPPPASINPKTTIIESQTSNITVAAPMQPQSNTLYPSLEITTSPAPLGVPPAYETLYSTPTITSIELNQLMDLSAPIPARIQSLLGFSIFSPLPVLPPAPSAPILDDARNQHDEHRQAMEGPMPG
jgi:hypothetical protein